MTVATSTHEEQEPPHGPVYRYDDAGNLVSYDTYMNGVLHGESRRYEEKYLVQRFFYNQGQLDGVFETYLQGRLILLTNYKNNLQNGQSIIYKENGLLKGCAHYLDGKLHGPFISYDAQGIVSQILHYQEDRKEGPFVSYFPSGGILERGAFQNDMEEGTFYGYYEDGALREVASYRAGVLIGSPMQYPPQLS